MAKCYSDYLIMDKRGFKRLILGKMRNVLILSNSFRAKTIGVIGKTFSPECGVSGGGWWLGIVCGQC